MRKREEGRRSLSYRKRLSDTAPINLWQDKVRAGEINAMISTFCLDWEIWGEEQFCYSV